MLKGPCISALLQVGRERHNDAVGCSADMLKSGTIPRMNDRSLNGWVSLWHGVTYAARSEAREAIQSLTSFSNQATRFRETLTGNGKLSFFPMRHKVGAEMLPRTLKTAFFEISLLPVVAGPTVTELLVSIEYLCLLFCAFHEHTGGKVEDWKCERFRCEPFFKGIK
jgi:hypothetical protein